MDLPLARYVLSPQEAAGFENAIAILARPCAARFGVISTLPANNVNLASDALLLDGRYGWVLTPEVAKRFGYDGAPQDHLQIDDTSKKASSWNPTPNEDEVLGGQAANGQPSTLVDTKGAKIHEGGCLGEASQQLQGGRNDRSALISLVSDGLAHSYDSLIADSRLTQANTAWVECMKTKGYNFGSRGDANRSVVNRSRSEQVRVATDDTACAQSVNLFGLMYALDVAYEQRFIDEHAAAFKTSSDAVRLAQKKAADVLARGS